MADHALSDVTKVVDDLEQTARDLRAAIAATPTHGAIGDGTLIKFFGPLIQQLLQNPAVQQFIMQWILKLLGGSIPTTPTVPGVGTPGGPWGSTP